MSIEYINRWHHAARPEPTERDFNVQLGCHLEEVAEMLADLRFQTAGFADLDGKDTVLYSGLTLFADRLKRGDCTATIMDRANFLKELCDQVVTATGVAYCAGMDFPPAMNEVDTSNWSKFDADGKPVRDEHGKIMKSEHYQAPNLRGLY